MSVRLKGSPSAYVNDTFEVHENHRHSPSSNAMATIATEQSAAGWMPLSATPLWFVRN